jgi:CheY-like chemotaxis protein
MNVLIVDDDDANREVLRALLESEGLQLWEARDGVEALALLEREREHIEAMICDILMPNMDGYRLCDEVRRSKKFHALPILLYTSTYTAPGDRSLGAAMGADAYLTKPSPTPDILAALEQAVAKSKARTSALVTIPTDTSFVMRQYNEVLVKKLEEKNSDLEKAVASLETAYARIVELNAGLEQRVSERTAELQKKNSELAEALANVKELSGLLPICAWCKKIRDGQNYWDAVETYVSKRTRAEFSHGICPSCLDKQLKLLGKKKKA